MVTPREQELLQLGEAALRLLMAKVCFDQADSPATQAWAERHLGEQFEEAILDYLTLTQIAPEFLPSCLLDFLLAEVEIRRAF